MCKLCRVCVWCVYFRVCVCVTVCGHWLLVCVECLCVSIKCVSVYDLCHCVCVCVCACVCVGCMFVSYLCVRAWYFLVSLFLDLVLCCVCCVRVVCDLLCAGCL